MSIKRTRFNSIFKISGKYQKKKKKKEKKRKKSNKVLLKPCA